MPDFHVHSVAGATADNFRKRCASINGRPVPLFNDFNSTPLVNRLGLLDLNRTYIDAYATDQGIFSPTGESLHSFSTKKTRMQVADIKAISFLKDTGLLDLDQSGVHQTLCLVDPPVWYDKDVEARYVVGALRTAAALFESARTAVNRSVENLQALSVQADGLSHMECAPPQTNEPLAAVLATLAPLAKLEAWEFISSSQLTSLDELSHTLPTTAREIYGSRGISFNTISDGLLAAAHFIPIVRRNDHEFIGRLELSNPIQATSADYSILPLAGPDGYILRDKIFRDDGTELFTKRTRDDETKNKECGQALRASALERTLCNFVHTDRITVVDALCPDSRRYISTPYAIDLVFTCAKAISKKRIPAGTIIVDTSCEIRQQGNGVLVREAYVNISRPANLLQLQLLEDTVDALHRPFLQTEWGLATIIVSPILAILTAVVAICLCCLYRSARKQNQNVTPAQIYEVFRPRNLLFPFGRTAREQRTRRSGDREQGEEMAMLNFHENDLPANIRDQLGNNRRVIISLDPHPPTAPTANN